MVSSLYLHFPHTCSLPASSQLAHTPILNTAYQKVNLVKFLLCSNLLSPLAKRLFIRLLLSNYNETIENGSSLPHFCLSHSVTQNSSHLCSPFPLKKANTK